MNDEELQLMAAVERAARQCVHGQVALPPSQWALDRLKAALKELDDYRAVGSRGTDHG